MWPYLAAMAAMSIMRNKQDGDNADRIRKLNAETTRLSPWTGRSPGGDPQEDPMGTTMQAMGAGMQMANMGAQTQRLNSGGNFFNSGQNTNLKTSGNPWQSSADVGPSSDSYLFGKKKSYWDT